MKPPMIMPHNMVPVKRVKNIPDRIMRLVVDNDNAPQPTPPKPKHQFAFKLGYASVMLAFAAMFAFSLWTSPISTLIFTALWLFVKKR